MIAAALPCFRSTEEATRYGAFITPRHYLVLLGAHTALRREFNEIRNVAGTQQLQADLATKIQLLREALEAAPNATLIALMDFKK